MDLLTHDALILITAKAAKESWITPDSYLRRYFKDEADLEQAKHFMFLVDLVYEKTEEISTWDPEYSLDNRYRTVLAWQDDE